MLYDAGALTSVSNKEAPGTTRFKILTQHSKCGSSIFSMNRVNAVRMRDFEVLAGKI